MKQYIVGFFSLLVLSVGGFSAVSQAASSTVEDLAERIIATAEADVHPQESLVQWYYSIADLYEKALENPQASKNQTKLNNLKDLKSLLRGDLDSKKSAVVKTGVDNFYDRYKDHLTSENEDLSGLCKSRFELADDWSFALNLPTALTIGILDMESSCRMNNPNNRNGIFQITTNDHEPGAIEVGHWIGMMYDFNDFLQRNKARYHNSNKLSIENCEYKDKTMVGQTAPVCLSYDSVDLDSLIKFGALYNGLAGSSIKGDIQPGAPQYVFGKFDEEYSGANKAGLLVRVLQVLHYEKNL